MCLAQVELIGDTSGEMGSGLSDVAWIERTPEGLRIVDLFGNVTELDAEIQSIDFMESVVCLETRSRAAEARGGEPPSANGEEA